jgi:micrococcal nuclease
MKLKKSLKLLGLFSLIVVIAAAVSGFERGETGQVSKILDGG